LLEGQGMVPVHQAAQCPPRQASIFRHLSEKQFNHIAPWLTHGQAKAGDYLFRYGDPGHTILIVVRGELEALLPYRKKRRMRLAVYGPGMEVGEAGFLNPGPRKADLRAISDVEWVALSHNDLMHIGDHHPRLAMQLISVLSKELGNRLEAADNMLRRLAE